MEAKEPTLLSKVLSRVPKFTSEAWESEKLNYESPTDETGWDRVKAMFIKDELGYRTGEMAFVIQGTLAAAFTGACIGSFLTSRETLHEFLRKNQDTLFQSQFDAKRRLNDQVLLSAARGAMRYGWKLAFLSGTYLFTVMTVSVYRNKTSIVEYVGGGVLSGSLYRFNLGLKGMFAGGLAGAMLGAVAGSLSLASMWLGGTSMEQVRYWKNQHKLQRQSEVHQTMVQKRTPELDVLEQAREKKD